MTNNGAETISTNNNREYQVETDPAKLAASRVLENIILDEAYGEPALERLAVFLWNEVGDSDPQRREQEGLPMLENSKEFGDQTYDYTEEIFFGFTGDGRLLSVRSTSEPSPDDPRDYQVKIIDLVDREYEQPSTHEVVQGSYETTIELRSPGDAGWTNTPDERLTVGWSDSRRRQPGHPGEKPGQARMYYPTTAMMAADRSTQKAKPGTVPPSRQEVARGYADLYLIEALANDPRVAELLSERANRMDELSGLREVGQTAVAAVTQGELAAVA